MIASPTVTPLRMPAAGSVADGKGYFAFAARRAVEEL
jgi:hypothetical protein